MGANLIRFPDRETGVRAIRAFYKVRIAYVCLPGDVWGVTDEHIAALKKAKIPFIYVSKKPSRKGKHASTVQS
jgi:hypothetical protein